MYSIGIRYCGGCNPQIDRAKVVSNLKAGLEAMEMDVELTTDRNKTINLALLINGCAHACLEEEYMREGSNIPFISVKGEMVDDSYMPEEAIPKFLIERIAHLL
jgi:hypothetical protein